MTDKEIDTHVKHVMAMFRIDDADAQASAAIEFVFRERHTYRQLIAQAFGFESEGVSVLAQCRALAAEMPRWVPCAEKLPEANQYVLAYVDMPQYLDGELIPEVKKTGYWLSEFCPDDKGSVDAWRCVIAWQPLPSPPREEA